MAELAVITTVFPPGTALPLESTHVPAAAQGDVGAFAQGGLSGVQAFFHCSSQVADASVAVAVVTHMTPSPT
jgi:hypothetical protein